MCVTVCVCMWGLCNFCLCVCGVLVNTNVCNCVYGVYVCGVCVYVCVLTSAETEVQVMELSCLITKQIVFLQIPWLWQELQARITISTVERKFVPNKHCEANRFLK